MRLTTHRTKSSPQGRRRSPGLGLWWTFAAALIVVAAFIVAVAGNGQSVRLHYLAWHVDVSLIVVILTTALVAVLLDEAGGLIWRRRRRARLDRRTELARLRAGHEEPVTPVEQLPLPTDSVAPAARPVGPAM